MCLIPVPNQSMNTSVKFLTYNYVYECGITRTEEAEKKDVSFLLAFRSTGKI